MEQNKRYGSPAEKAAAPVFYFIGKTAAGALLN